MLAGADLQRLRSIRARAGGREACGLLLTDGDALRLVEVANRAPDPTSAFLLDRDALLAAAHDGTLRGCWHTHPTDSAVPSPDDLASMAAWPDLVYVIVGARVRAWRWTPDGAVECPGLLSSARP